MRARHARNGGCLRAGAAAALVVAAVALGAEEARGPVPVPRDAAGPAADPGGAPAGEEGKAGRILGYRTLAEYLGDEPQATRGNREAPGGLLRILGWTASIAVGFIALLLAYRRFVPAGRILAGGPIRVIARSQVTPRHGLALVRVGNRAYLLALAGDRIERIAEFQDPAEVMALAGDFAGELERAGAPAGRDPLECFRVEIDRLRDLLRARKRPRPREEEAVR